VYAGEYMGYLSEYEEGTGQYRNISIYPANLSGIPPKEYDYRFQWTAPIEISPHDPAVLYHGANVLFRSSDRGASWQAISGDLTRDDETKQEWSGGPITGDITGVETYDTIFSIAESRITKGLVWVGTDDGLVHLTRDGGSTWANITPGGMPEWGTVECVEPSRRDAGTAYVVVDARRLDDQRPHLFRTTDYGKSWKRLVTGLPDDQPLFVVREDPTDAKLLYLGGERGLWLSRDAGASWKQVRQGLPPVAVPDIEVKHDALVLGTRRGIWALDDITALRQFGDSVKGEAAHVFAPLPAIRWQYDYWWGDQGQTKNPPYGATFTYWLKDESKDDIKAEILDAGGRVIRTLTSVAEPLKYAKDDPDEPTDEEPKPELTKVQGLNRATWDLRMEGARRIFSKIDAGDPEKGPLVAPGRYTLRLSAAGRTLEQPVEVLRDPRSPATDAEIAENVAFAVGARDAMDRILADVEALRAIREQVSDLRQRTVDNLQAGELRTTADAIVARCDELEAELHNPKAEVTYDVLAGREGGAKLYGQVSPLAAWIQAADYPATQGMRERFAYLQSEIARVESAIAALRAGDLVRLEEQARALDLPRIIVPEAR
jgi:hypothetical protein